MKRTVKTSRTAGYLEKMFRQMNNDLFNGELEEPIITIQSSLGSYGHVSVAKVWKRNEENQHELNISADWLDRPIEEVAATMLHEMVHLLNMQRGIQDCSRGGSYHNKAFKEEAEKHLLQIEKHETYGWTITKVTEALLDYVITNQWDEIMMTREVPLLGFSGGIGKTTTKGTSGTKAKPKGSNSRKHTCPQCGRIARTTADFPLICGICKIEMEVEH